MSVVSRVFGLQATKRGYLQPIFDKDRFYRENRHKIMPYCLKIK